MSIIIPRWNITFTLATETESKLASTTLTVSETDLEAMLRTLIASGVKYFEAYQIDSLNGQIQAVKDATDTKVDGLYETQDKSVVVSLRPDSIMTNKDITDTLSA